MKRKDGFTYPSTLAGNSQMKQERLLLPVLFSIVILVLISANVTAQTPSGSAFTYQGQLKQGDNPADGTYQMTFELHTDSDGTGPALDSLVQDVTVTAGLFTVQLDFGSAVFDGDPRWLKIGVRQDIADPYDFVSPLQPLTAAPYALFALNSNSPAHSHTPSHNNCVWISVAHATDGPRESFCPTGRFTAGVRANETADNEADISHLYCCSP